MKCKFYNPNCKKVDVNHAYREKALSFSVHKFAFAVNQLWTSEGFSTWFSSSCAHLMCCFSHTVLRWYMKWDSAELMLKSVVCNQMFSRQLEMRYSGSIMQLCKLCQREHVKFGLALCAATNKGRKTNNSPGYSTFTRFNRNPKAATGKRNTQTNQRTGAQKKNKTQKQTTKGAKIPKLPSRSTPEGNVGRPRSLHFKKAFHFTTSGQKQWGSKNENEFN